MKNITLLLLCLGYSLAFNSQDTFKIFYPNPYFALGGGAGSSVHVQNDTIYVICAAFINANLETMGYIIKFDFQGNVLDSIPVDNFNPDFHINLGRIGGNILESDGIVCPHVSFNNIIQENEESSLLKLSLNGDVIWKTNISTDSLRRHFYRKVIPFHDGYAVIGTINDSLYSYTFEAQSGIVTVTDSVGNMQWTHEYDEVTSLFNAHPTFDGGLILSTTKWIGPGPNHYDSQTIKVDSLGNEQWRYVFGGNGNEGGFPIIQMKDSSYVIFGTDDDLPDFGFSRGPIWIHRIIDTNNTAGYIVTDNIYYDFEDSDKIPNDIIQLADSSIIMAGTNGYYNSPGNGIPSMFWQASISKYAPNLDSVWTHYYKIGPQPSNIQTYHVLSDIKVMPDGGFITTGYMLRPPNDPEYPSVIQAILIRVDEYGCLEPDCQLTGIAEIIIGLENTMVLYPNPVRSGQQLHLQFAEQVGYAMPYASDDTQLMIYDMMGREVYRQQISRRGSNDSFDLVLDVPTLSAGQYSVQWVGEAWYDSVRFVVE